MKKLLIVVDYQKDFVDGTMPVNGAKELDDYIANLILEYRKHDNDVMFTMDTHDDDYLQTEEGKAIPTKHCIRGTEGYKLYGKVGRLSGGSLIFEKRAFPSSQLCFYLRGAGYDEVTLVGVVSNVCVLANAIMVKAALPYAHIVIDAKGCASSDLEMEKKAYDVCKGLLIEVKNA